MEGGEGLGTLAYRVSFRTSWWLFNIPDAYIAAVAPAALHRHQGAMWPSANRSLPDASTCVFLPPHPPSTPSSVRPLRPVPTLTWWTRALTSKSMSWAQ
jgi:hypothetical protein